MNEEGQIYNNNRSKTNRITNETIYYGDHKNKTSTAVH